jgi:hypothetical protein
MCDLLMFNMMPIYPWRVRRFLAWHHPLGDHSGLEKPGRYIDWLRIIGYYREIIISFRGLASKKGTAIYD